MPSFLVSTKSGRCGVVSDTCMTMALLRVLAAGEEIAGCELVEGPSEFIADGQNQTPIN